MAISLKDVLKVGDYLKVEQKVVCYEAGEIAHIENVMIGEKRERKNTYMEREEQITETESVTENEQERDTQTSERYTMQREAQKVVNQDLHFDVSLSISGPAGPMTLAANTGFSMGQSTQQSNKTASDYAKSVVEIARNRTFQRTRNYEKLTVIKQWEDINTHSFENIVSDLTPDISNKVGIYRWVDKKYENRLMNYGKRLILTLMIPDPAAWHRFAATMPVAGSSTIEMPPPLPEKFSPSYLTDSNYVDLAGQYGAQVKPVPDLYTSVSKPFSYATSETYDTDLTLPSGTYPVKATKPTETTTAKDDAIAIPDGYSFDRVACGIRYYSRSVDAHVYVRVENLEFYANSANNQHWEWKQEGWTDFKRTTIPITIFADSFVDSYVVNVQLRLKRTDALYGEWQLDTYNAIIEANERKKSEYASQLEALKANTNQQYGNNPTKNRLIEQQELKKSFIAMLNEDTDYFTQFNETYRDLKGSASLGYPSIDTYSVFNTMDSPTQKVSFFEEAFDWDIMSYKFYPYYWQGQDYTVGLGAVPKLEEGRWSKVYSIRDNDDIFEKFLQAGYAQVVVPVKLDFELEVLNFLAHGVIVNSDFYTTIPEITTAKREILDPAKPTEDEPMEIKKWYTKAPTNLVILQTSAQGAAGVGLPCWESDDKRLNPDLFTLDDQFGALTP